MVFEMMEGRLAELRGRVEKKWTRLWMTMIFLGLSLAWVSFCPGGLWAETPPLDQLLERMQEAYDGTSDLRARFVQETSIKAAGRKQREEGIVYFKKPRQMLWEYVRPRAKKLVINNRKAWFYVPQENAVYVQDADRIFKSQLAVRFLSGIGKLQDDFQISYDPDRAVDDQGRYRLVLTPKGPDHGLESLRMTVDGRTYQVVDCRFSDTYGNQTWLQFRDMQLNTGLQDRLFDFKPPPKAEVFPMQ
jgi:outer membrane lipoprotein carrier protein